MFGSEQEKWQGGGKNEENHLSESVFLNNLKWHWWTRKVCNSGDPVTEVWLTVPITFTFSLLLSRCK